MLEAKAIGYLGKDAVVNQSNGKAVINFNVAHTEKYMKDGVQHERTTWVSCSYWPEKTTIAQYLKKGTQVYVSGKPGARAYIIQGQSEPKADLSLTVYQCELLGRKPEGNNTDATSSQSTSSHQADMSGDVPDDLPF